MSEDSDNFDYKSKPSVRATGSVAREKADPRAGLEPISLWLFATCAGVLIVGGGYLGAKSAGFDFDKTTADIADQRMPNIQRKAKAKTPLEAYLEAGKAVYSTTCNGCHQSGGQGQGQIPPLVGSEWPAEGTERFAQIVLNGLRGPIKVGGVTYGAQDMQAQKASLNDSQIAQVMTYVRHTFSGVTDGVVTKEMIADARNRFGDRPVPYSAAELSPADVMLPGEQPAWADPDAAAAAGGAEAGADAGGAPAENATPPPVSNPQPN